jgi:hypothetical protein
VKLAILCAAAACPVILVACGGGGGGTSSESVTSDTTAQGGSPQAGNGSGANRSKQAGGGSKQGGAVNGDGLANGGSGGGSGSARGQSSGGIEHHTGFKVPGGDNSIQEFGQAAAGSDLSQADEAVAALFRAFNSADWSEVCGKYLTKKTFESIQKIAQSSPVAKGKSCPEVLGALYSTGVTPNMPESGVGAMRIDGELGFALYRGTDGKGYAIAMENEGGRWKLSSLGPTPLEP